MVQRTSVDFQQRTKVLRQRSRVEHRACSSVVERPFCIRKALGSIPNLSIFHLEIFYLEYTTAGRDRWENMTHRSAGTFFGGLILHGGQGEAEQHNDMPLPQGLRRDDARSAKTRERRSAVAGVREWIVMCCADRHTY
jgi:hypothetical protein